MHPLLDQLAFSKQMTMRHFGVFDDSRYCWVIPVRLKLEDCWQEMMESLYGRDYCLKYGYGAIHNLHGVKVYWSNCTTGVWFTFNHPDTIASVCQSTPPMHPDKALEMPIPVITEKDLERLASQGEQLLRQDENRVPDWEDDDDDPGEAWKRG